MKVSENNPLDFPHFAFAVIFRDWKTGLLFSRTRGKPCNYLLQVDWQTPVMTSIYTHFNSPSQQSQLGCAWVQHSCWFCWWPVLLVRILSQTVPQARPRSGQEGLSGPFYRLSKHTAARLSSVSAGESYRVSRSITADWTRCTCSCWAGEGGTCLQTGETQSCDSITSRWTSPNRQT